MNWELPTPNELNAMSDREFEEFESKLRRLAWQKGPHLTKSRTRDPFAFDLGTYTLVGARTDSVAAGNYGTGLHEVARALMD